MTLPSKKTSEELLKALTGNIPESLIIPKEPETPKSVIPSNEVIVKDSEDDYEFARNHIKKSIQTSDEAIAAMFALASDAEHPRAFEVLATMIRNHAEISGQLMDLIKSRKKIAQETVPGVPSSGNINTTNNNTVIFSGSTADLQKYLKSREEVIET